MREITFATGNNHKIGEVSKIFSEYFGEKIKLLGLKDHDISIDISEPYQTFEQNSQHKAEIIYKNFGFDVFSEDSGLVVEELGGEPGVLSARYAGNHDDSENIQKVLDKLQGKNNRKAKFVSVITLILNGEIAQFKGECNGQISFEWDGSLSFGYDPIFIPEGYDLPFSKLGKEIKNKVSHRKVSLQNMIDFIQTKI